MSLNPSRPSPGRRENVKLNFCFHIPFGASKVFMKTYIKPFEAPQRTVKNILLNFHSNTTFRDARDGKG